MGDEERNRLVILGAGQVGKTAIVSRFLRQTFPETYKATVEDLHCRDYDINGTQVKVDILDTAGNLAFPAMRRLSITTAHAFILVYSIDDLPSFQEIRTIWEQIKEQRANFQDLPCVIVGNKSDLETARQVELADAQAWAASEGMESSLLEISAKDNTDVINIFQKLLDQAKIPNIRLLEPILKRRLSAKDNHMNPQRQKLKEQEERLSRSRSLIRRSSKPKVKHTGDPNRNDCVIS